MSDLRVDQVAAERLGFQVAANAERRLTGRVREPLRVELLDAAGEVVALIPAADPLTALVIAAELRGAGWRTRTGGAL